MMRFFLAFILLCQATGVVAANQRQTLFEVAKRAIEGFDGRDRGAVRDATWPDGYYVQGTLKRHWEDVPFGGVILQTTFGKPVISVRGSRADIRVSYTLRIYYDIEEPPRECSTGIYHFDLRRRLGDWRVLNLTAAPRSSTKCRRSEESL
jgi:hypothetical protein